MYSPLLFIVCGLFDLLSKYPASFVLLLVKWSPHSLDFIVILKHSVCLGILEAHIAVTISKVEDYQRVYAAVLIVWAHANKQQIECIWTLDKHSLQKVPPAER